MSDLVSKVLSGGLSAAIFLLWWPAHVPAEGPEWLVVRGLLWTLAFEILMLSFCPLERTIGTAVRERRSGAVAPRRLGRVLALATAGLAIPAALVGATGDLGAPAKAAAAAPPKVIVKREIVRREIVVRRVNHVVRVPVAQTPVATQAAATAAATGRLEHARRRHDARARDRDRPGGEGEGEDHRHRCQADRDRAGRRPSGA